MNLKIKYLFIILFFLALNLHVYSEETALSDLNTAEFNNLKKDSQDKKWEKNPFVKPMEEIGVDDLILTGIIYSKKKRAALINTLIVFEKDKIGLNEIQKIEDNFVLIKNENGLARLELKVTE
jgi:hypothetical protein